MEKSPNSRFKEYTDVWKPSKLSQIATRITRKNDALESDLVLTISAQYGLIDQNDFFNKRIASNLLQGYFLMRKGEFAYNKSYSSEYPVGAVKRLNNYDMGVLSTLYILFSIQDEPLAEWIEHFFETSKWHNEIIKRASEGARNHGLLNISPADFFDLPFLYPSSEIEQYKIAQFFSRFDALIIAEDKKLEKLKNYKNASFEKMFPRKGETIPQIRFDGFKGEWAKKELSEVAGYYRVSNENVHHQNLLSLSYGKIVKRNIKSKKGLLPASFDTYQVIKENIIVLRFTDLQNDHKSLRVGLSKEEGIISPAYICLECKDNINPDYLYLLLHYYDLCKVFYGMGDGMRQTLSYSDIKDLLLIIPEDEKEQKSIVDFFSRIDLLVSSQEKKLRNLRSLRKALLERMFVSAQ
jgi:type I restriction enzyme S subunit